MLDFYLIGDKQVEPEYPTELNLIFVSGIEFNTYSRLQRKGIIEGRYSFYSDFRWTNTVINNLFEKIKNTADTDCVQLRKILEVAIKSKKELITYCD